MRQRDHQGHVCQAKGFEFYSVEYELPLKNFKQVPAVIRTAFWTNINHSSMLKTSWGEWEWKQSNQSGRNQFGSDSPDNRLWVTIWGFLCCSGRTYSIFQGGEILFTAITLGWLLLDKGLMGSASHKLAWRCKGRPELLVGMGPERAEFAVHTRVKQILNSRK